MTKTKRFKGALSERPASNPEPMRYGLLKDLFSEQAAKEAADREKWLYQLLFEHYGIELWNWQTLAPRFGA